MALNPKRANAAVNAECVAVGVELQDGYLRIYDGAQPATADTALGAQVLLAELRFNSGAGQAFNAPSAGVATAKAITSDASGTAGTAAWCRALKSDGTTPVLDGSVGTASADCVLNTVVITGGVAVAVSSFTYTADKE